MKAIILKAPGTNRDYDVQSAIEQAGVRLISCQFPVFVAMQGFCETMACSSFREAFLMGMH